MVMVRGHGRGAELGGMSLKRAKRARTGFRSTIREEVAEIVHGVPQHASFFSPVVDVPSPTSSVPIFSLD